MAIKDIRKRAGITRAFLARAVGVSERTMGNWERGHTEPSISHAYRLAVTLGCDISDIFPPPKKSESVSVGECLTRGEGESG